MKFQVYKGKDGKFYWRAKARNGRIIADGAQGYKHKRSCLNSLIGLCVDICNQHKRGETFKIDDTKA
jgi:uncharacterized protein YegP (UPF0339 family)